jgi:hypothetical protein
MFNVQQLKELIIKPALIDLIMFSEDAFELLVLTCAVESAGGTYLKQVKGRALGIYQMEPDTYNDIWQNYIIKKNDLSLLMATNFDCSRMPDEDRLIYDLRFATAMARLHYARFPEPIPSKENLKALYAYYKKYYNTALGASEEDKSIRKYLGFINS